jgi:hypothetical protein
VDRPPAMQREANVARPAGTARGSQQILERPRRRGIHAQRKDAADQPVGRFAKELSRGGVGVEHLEVGRVEHENAVARQLKEQAVARFHMTQAPVVTLHRLLGFHQPLLQRRHVAHVAPHRHEAAVTPELDRGVRHGHVHDVAHEVIHLAALRHSLMDRFLEQRVDLGARVARHGLVPRPADPLGGRIELRVPAAHEGHVADDAGPIHDKRNVPGHR